MSQPRLVAEASVGISDSEDECDTKSEGRRSNGPNLQSMYQRHRRLRMLGDEVSTLLVNYCITESLTIGMLVGAVCWKQTGDAASLL